jgi:hypothetical protein
VKPLIVLPGIRQRQQQAPAQYRGSPAAAGSQGQRVALPASRG